MIERVVLTYQKLYSNILISNILSIRKANIDKMELTAKKNTIK